MVTVIPEDMVLVEYDIPLPLEMLLWMYKTDETDETDETNKKEKINNISDLFTSKNESLIKRLQGRTLENTKL